MIAPVGPNDRHTGRDADLASLTTEQREWAVRSEALWRRAHAIAAAHPDAVCNSPHPGASPPVCNVDDFALTPAERRLFAAFDAHGVRYVVIDLGAAVLQGAPLSTQDLDLWFEQPGGEPLRRALADAGGFRVPAFGLQPPGIGGDGFDRLDTVLTAHGLDDFATEYAHALDFAVDDVVLKVLPLDRIIHSKRATGRPKDLAALPALDAALHAREDESA